MTDSRYSEAGPQELMSEFRKGAVLEGCGVKYVPHHEKQHHDDFIHVDKEICGFISVHVLKLKRCTNLCRDYSVEITNFSSGTESF